MFSDLVVHEEEKTFLGCGYLWVWEHKSVPYVHNKQRKVICTSRWPWVMTGKPLFFLLPHLFTSLVLGEAFCWGKSQAMPGEECSEQSGFEPGFLGPDWDDSECNRTPLVLSSPCTVMEVLFPVIKLVYRQYSADKGKICKVKLKLWGAVLCGLFNLSNLIGTIVFAPSPEEVSRIPGSS